MNGSKTQRNMQYVKANATTVAAESTGRTGLKFNDSVRLDQQC